MLSSRELLKLLVGLHETSDLKLISSESVLSSVCRQADRPEVLAMSEIVDRLLTNFDYEKSPEFVSKLTGKSEDVQAMHRKLLSPEKRKQQSQRLGKALTEILDTHEAFELVPILQHKSLDELKNIALNLSN